MSEGKRYRLELYFSGRYRDVELSDTMEAPVMIGTTRGCMVRFSRDDFFDDFNLSVSHNAAGEWTVESGNGVYLSTGDLLKLRSLAVHHGASFTIHYQESGALLCRCQFLREFESSGKSYTRFVELTGISGLTIGGNPGCQIVVRDEALGSDSILLQRQGNRWLLAENHTRYGMAVNGVYRTGQKVINDYDFFSLVGHGFFLRGERLYYENSDDVQARGLTVKEHRDSLTRMEYPKLNQSTRVYYKVPKEEITIQNPPQKIKPPEENLLETIAPALVMLVLAVLLRGVMGNGGTYVIFSVCSMGVGIVTSIYNYRRQKTDSIKNETERVNAYTGYIQRKDGEIQALRQKEISLKEANAPNIETTLSSVWRFDGRLYERRAGDEDYLCVRLGAGITESDCPVKYTAQEFRDESDPLTLWPEQVEQKYHNLPQAPILVSLTEVGTIGIVGNGEAQTNTVRSMTVDLAVHHSHQNLQIAFIFAEKDKETWGWTKWLRHVNNPVSHGRNIVYNEDSYKDFIEFLYKEFCNREPLAGNKKVVWPVYYVIYVLEPFDLMRHPISRFISSAQNYGVCFVFCQEAEELLPPCQKLIRLQGDGATLIDAHDGNKVQAYKPQLVQESQLVRMAVKMACITVDEVSLAAQLTKSITLFKLFGIYSADDLDLESRWATSEVYRSMAAPLGVNVKGETVYLDLHEKAHGPHGLVAGTTGSGKSEILQSYILSVATLYHPYEIAFVIIDFKGGGMANQFQDLPHMLGAITNIDGNEIDRSLSSIKAELVKRQGMFAEAGVNHIDAYIRKYKNGELEKPLPHLVIIVDEFAELKAEYPDFMKELVSAARIGRSLGVHLILATQKPSGQVSEQIWSNSRFKLCLKVQTPEDSNEMIKSPLAAEIIEPGRAYFQVGNNEIFELFQSGFSGAKEKGSTDEFRDREYSIFSIDLAGKKELIFRKKKEVTEKSSRTQLEAIVEYVHDYCEEKGIEKLPNICMPPLPKWLSFPQDPVKNASVDIITPVGIVDDPDRQKQEMTYINLTSDNTIIIGSSQYGKTNLLQTIIRGIAENYTPKEVNIYILDFASMVLKNFESLNHVGGVVCASDDEKFKNLFKLLSSEIEIRKEKLVEAGVSSFGSYKEMGRKDLPQIVLLIDNYTAVRELYLQEEDPLLNVCREGIAVGISVVLCNQQTAGISFRYLSTFAKRIVLYCNESSEYSGVIERCRMAPANVPGRALTEIQKNIYEMQTYISFEGEREIDRVLQMRNFVEKQNERYCGMRARHIPEIPSVLTEEAFQRDFGIVREHSYVVPVGLDYENISPVNVDLTEIGTFAVLGRSGATDAILQIIFSQLYENMFSAPAEVYLVDGVRKDLKSYGEYGFVVGYTVDSSDLAGYVESVYDIALTRYENMMNEGFEISQEPLQLVVVRNDQAIQELCKNAVVMKKYKELLGRLKSTKVCFLYMDVENTTIPYSAPEILKDLKEKKNFFFFDDLTNLKVCDISAATVRRYKKKLSAGDAYWLCGNEIEKIKVVTGKDE